MKKKNTLNIAVFFVLISCISVSFAQNVALNFDGSNDYVQTTYPGITGNAARTVEAWVRTTASGSTQKVIVDWGDMTTGARFTINMLQNNSLRIEIGGSGLPGTIAINDGNWHHIAVVYNPMATLQYATYVDGAVNAQGNLPTTINTSSINNLMLGKRNDGINYWQGDIDEVRIFNYAKTQAQIQASMSTEFCPLPTGLVAYFKLNGGTPGVNNAGHTTALNSVSTQNGGLFGFALSGATSNWVAGPVLTNNNTYSTMSAFNCSAYTGPSGNYTWTQSGSFTDTLVNTAGCDSIVTVNLTIGASQSSITAFSCGSYTAPSGTVITTYGSFYDTLYNANALGCDSIVHLILVSGKNYATVNTSACDTLITAGGKIVTQSGTVVDTLTNANQYGCDSIITYHVTIIGNTPQNIPVEACESYTSTGGVSYSASGTYTEIYSSLNGCDSVINYTITINSSVSTNQTIAECDSALINGIWYTSTQQLQFSEVSNQGCDSIVTINLTIGTVDATISQNTTALTANQAGATYQWIDCATSLPIAGETNQTFVATENGQYAVEVIVGNCSETSDCATVTGIKVEEIEEAKFFAVYPNPSHGNFTIKFNNTTFNGTVEVIDVLGKVVHTENVSTRNTLALNLNVTTGIYFIVVKTATETISEKIVIE